MVIHAYDEEYFESARRIMGDLFDFAMVTAGVSPETLQKMMITSSSIRQFEKGNPSYVAGMTGCELFIKMVEESGLSIKIPAEEMYLDKSPEYWSGWAIAFYQWYSGKTFERIFEYISIEELLNMYPVFHEMDIMQFVDEVDKKIASGSIGTRLSIIRKYAGLTQKELSEISEVPLRQIQLFEQRQRDINKCQAETLLRLSKALKCNIEDILEI